MQDPKLHWSPRIVCSACGRDHRGGGPTCRCRDLMPLPLLHVLWWVLAVAFLALLTLIAGR